MSWGLDGVLPRAWRLWSSGPATDKPNVARAASIDLGCMLTCWNEREDMKKLQVMIGGKYVGLAETTVKR